MEKYKDTPLTFYNKNFFKMKNYDVKIFNMPEYFPDAELGSYGVSIKKY